jgi:hypothetical protein
VLAREIGEHHLRPDVLRRQIDLDAIPTTLPFRVGEKTTQDLGIEIAFAFEIAIETAAGQPRSRHDLIE